MKSMLKLIFICAALSGPVVYAQSTVEVDDQPFHISSRDSGFGVQGEFEGTYRVTESSIEVYVRKGMLYVSEHCPYQGRRRINYIQFGLRNQDGSRWRFENSSAPLYLYAVMSPREEYPLSELHLSLPKDSTLDLTKRWLMVQIQEDALDLPTDQQKNGYAYVHSCEAILLKRGDELAQQKPCKGP